MENSSSSSTERVTGSDRSTGPLACQTLARTPDRRLRCVGCPAGWSGYRPSAESVRTGADHRFSGIAQSGGRRGRV